MAMLIHEKYIDGLAAKYFCDGAVIISGTFPRITLRGLEYLEERRGNYEIREYDKN